MPVELIVVDDCSTDGTREHLQEMQREHGFTLLLQERNQGKGAALRRRFAAVTGNIVAIQDADLEYSPEELPELAELIVEGRADVVYGSRFLGRHRVFLFTHYLGQPCPDAAHQRALQHDADGHGDLLQGDAARGP